MSSGVADVVGFAGAVLIIAAYVYVTVSKAPNPLLHHGLNLAGATLLVLSLLVNTNLPALVLEAVWAAVALAGLAISLRRRNAKQ